MAPPAGGSNATIEVSENLLSIFARFPGRGPPSTGALLCLMRRPTQSSLKFRHLGVPVRPQLSQPAPAKVLDSPNGAIMYALANIDFSNRFGVVVSELPDEIDDQDQTLDALEIAVFGAA